MNLIPNDSVKADRLYVFTANTYRTLAKLRSKSTEMQSLSPHHFEHFHMGAAASSETGAALDTRGVATYFCIFGITEALQDTWYKTRANEAFAEQWQQSV